MLSAAGKVAPVASSSGRKEGADGFGEPQTGSECRQLKFEFELRACIERIELLGGAGQCGLASHRATEGGNPFLTPIFSSMPVDGKGVWALRQQQKRQMSWTYVMVPRLPRCTLQTHTWNWFLQMLGEHLASMQAHADTARRHASYLPATCSRLLSIWTSTDKDKSYVRYTGTTTVRSCVCVCV